MGNVPLLFRVRRTWREHRGALRALSDACNIALRRGNKQNECIESRKNVSRTAFHHSPSNSVACRRSTLSLIENMYKARKEKK